MHGKIAIPTCPSVKCEKRKLILEKNKSKKKTKKKRERIFSTLLGARANKEKRGRITQSFAYRGANDSPVSTGQYSMVGYY